MASDAPAALRPVGREVTPTLAARDRLAEPPLGRPQHQLGEERRGQPDDQPDQDPVLGVRPVALAHRDEDRAEHRHEEDDPARPVGARSVVAAQGVARGPRTAERERRSARHRDDEQGDEYREDVREEHDVVGCAPGMEARRCRRMGEGHAGDCGIGVSGRPSRDN